VRFARHAAAGLALAVALIVIGPAASAHAELNQPVNLTGSPYFLVPQSQADLRWGVFPIGPSNLVQPAGDPAQRINIARCGCLLTSLSTTIEMLAAGSVPWFAHTQVGPGGFTPKVSFSPKYLDDYFNVGPNLSAPRPPGWGYLTGSGGTKCAVGVHPWAATHLAEPLQGAVAPTGVTWTAQPWTAAARAEIDAALLGGRPSIVLRKIQSGSGLHANLVVGWNNTTKRYLIYDPLWTFSGAAPAGTNFSGATDEERYSNWFAAVQTVIVPTQVYSPSLWMSIVALTDENPHRGARAGQAAPAPGVRLRLTDPGGHRTGYDPATGTMLHEDTSASYEEFTSFADPLGTLDEKAAVPSIAARDPQTGTYGLEVFGTRDGSFTLQLATVNGDQEQGATTIAGTITAGATKRFEVARSGAGVLTVSAVAAFGPRARAGNDGSGYAGIPVSFDGRGSNQPDGAITGFQWSFGDGANATGAQATHAYAAPGTYVATLTVTNANGLQATDTRTITIVPAPVHPRETIRANVTDAGVEANNESWFPHVSPDGRYVSFSSHANNLVASDGNGEQDVFVKDLTSGAVERVSVADNEAEGNAYAAYSAVSDNGRIVAFQSDATNLGGTATGLYVRDRQAGTTQFLAQLDSSNPRDFSISGDGRYVALRTYSALDPADMNGSADIYVRDRQASSWERIGSGSDPHISGDGRFLAFTGNFGAGDTTPGFVDVYVRDLQAGTTTIASRGADGAQIAGRHSFNPSISADGRYVAFDVNTATADVQVGSSTARPDIFVRDRQAATTDQVNVGSFDTGAAITSSISADGRYVAFVYGASLSLASVLHVYMRDRLEAATEQMSVATDGSVAAPAGASFDREPSVTPDGSVLFWTNAANLVADDTNGVHDVFLRRPLPPTGGPVTPLANLGGPYVGWATSTAVPAAIRLDGSGSLDPASRVLTAHWDFGDGSAPVDGALAISHAYTTPGVYDVTLTVKAASDTSAPLHTRVEVLPALPPAGLSVSACASAGGTLAISGAAPAANGPLIAQGWDTSTGPLTPAAVTITLPWGQVQAPATLPSLSFATTATVPAAQANGSYSATVAGASSSLHLPCATPANRPPLADAGGPTYSAAATVPATFDGTHSSDPEGAALTYRWNFGDGTTATGATPTHVYPAAGAYLATLLVNDGVNDSLEDIGTRSFALVVVGAAPGPPPPAPPPGPAPPPPPPAPVAISPDARCANGMLRLIDVYPDGGRVRIRGVAPAAARGQAVAITFAATGKRVASAVVAADLSFATSAPLPARKLRRSNRARYTATVAGQRSAALKLSRRMYLKTVTRAADRLRVTGQVVAPLARLVRERRVALRITTTCTQAASANGGRTVTIAPSARGTFATTIRLTEAELSAQALYVRGQTSVRRNGRSRGVIRTSTLVRGV
jgi:PKD repeat protein